MLQVYVDGSTEINAGIGLVAIKTEADGSTWQRQASFLYEAQGKSELTELEAIKAGMRMAIRLDPEACIEIYSDACGLVSQINRLAYGEKVKIKKHKKETMKYIASLMRKHDICLSFTPRETPNIKVADKLANKVRKKG